MQAKKKKLGREAGVCLADGWMEEGKRQSRSLTLAAKKRGQVRDDRHKKREAEKKNAPEEIRSVLICI